MKKTILIIVSLILTIFLTSCIKDQDTTKYEGTYLLDLYYSDFDESTLPNNLVSSYKITLDNKGNATEEYKVGLMEDVTITNSTYTVYEDKNLIEFRYIVDIYSSYVNVIL